MKIPRRALVQLAQTGDLNKHMIGGYFLSEKLDGQRCLWDGGITRGMDVRKVPWANIEKIDRFVNQDIISTGLWTRYGHPIQAPVWWVDNLPEFPLDGELWLGRGSFQELMSITRRLSPDDNDEDWKAIKLMVFDAPAYSEIFELGEIKELHYNKLIHPENLLSLGVPVPRTVPRPFQAKMIYLGTILESFGNIVNIHSQRRLPYDNLRARLIVETELEKVVGGGGEGLMLRCPNSYWTPRRVNTLLKIKSVNDAEGTVVGVKAGELGKYHGMMGALRINYNGKIFDLSGFTDAERVLTGEAQHFALSNPGAILPKNLISSNFPTGAVINFSYRELTVDGYPKEARYCRKL